MKEETEEKSHLIYDVVFPPDLIFDIKTKGKCDPKKLATDGMVLVFDSLLPKEHCNPDTFSEIPRRFCDEDGRVIILNIDNYFEEVTEACEFMKLTGKVGEFPLWLFQNTFYLTELYSKKKINELDAKELGGGHNQIHAKYIQILNEEADKIGKEHWCIFVSTHEYLLKPFYVSQFLEIHRKHFNNIGKKQANSTNKTRCNFTKSIRHEVFKKYGYKCADCGKSKDEVALHIDHILPICQGGTDDLDNLQCLCRDCNLAKKGRYFIGGC